MEKKLCRMCKVELPHPRKKFCSRKCFYKRREKKREAQEALKLHMAATQYLDSNNSMIRKESFASLAWTIVKMAFLGAFLMAMLFGSLAFNSIAFFIVVGLIVAYLIYIL